MKTLITFALVVVLTAATGVAQEAQPSLSDNIAPVPVAATPIPAEMATDFGTPCNCTHTAMPAQIVAPAPVSNCGSCNSGCGQISLVTYNEIMPISTTRSAPIVTAAPTPAISYNQPITNYAPATSSCCGTTTAAPSIIAQPAPIQNINGCDTCGNTWTTPTNTWTNNCCDNQRRRIFSRIRRR